MGRPKKQTDELVDPAIPDVAIPHIEVRERAMSAQDIIERRLALGDRAVVTTANVVLKPQAEPMVTRWINTAITGRFYQVTQQMGWTPVPYDQVENAKQTADLKPSEEGYACRGEKGVEVLVMMPKRYYNAIQAKKASDERADMRSAKLLRERTQESLAKDGLNREADRFGKLHVDEYEESVERHQFER